MLDYGEDLVKCAECDYGLAPLSDALKHKSYNKWRDKLFDKYYKRMRHEN